MEPSETIKSKITGLLKNKFAIETLNSSDWDTELSNAPFSFNARDMVYLLFEIEKLFQIRIKNEDLIAKKFFTLNNIVECINSALSSTAMKQ